VGTFSVRVQPDNLRFSCAHWLLFGTGECESVHGHNYRASVELEGTLDETGYVFDFSVLKRIARGICDRLSHHVLLAAENAELRITRSGGTLEAAFRAKRYAFPVEDVVLLPLTNTTAEQLARYVAREVVRELSMGHPAAHLARIRVGIEEAPGQMAFFEERLRPA
jgi:6-pyruvoyltetrahydropterin/6-carboxytetrahydropterin synthase